METRQSSRVNISANTLPIRTVSPQRLPPPPLPPPYTAVKHETSGKQFHNQRLRPPNYTPPPPYSSPPDSHTHTHTATAEAFSHLSEEDRSCDLRQMEQSHRGGHTQCSSSSDGTQHLLELQKPSRNQPSQSSGHEEEHQTPRSHTTLTKPRRRRRRRRSEGTVLISHTKNIMGSSGSPDTKPLKYQTLPTSGENQLEDEDNSCRQLNSFTRGPTATEEPREEHQNHKDYNEELRTESPRKRHTLNPQSPTPEETHHQTIAKFPFWKEPRSSHSLLNSTEISKTSREVQREQSEARGTSVSEENMGLMLIDATCVLIKVGFIRSTEQEPVQYVSSCVSSNKNHEQVRRSELMVIKGTRPTSSKVRPEHKTSEEGTETIVSNRTEDQSSVSEDKAMLEISEVPHRNVVRFQTGHEAMTNTRQDNGVQSAGGMFTLEEKVPDAAERQDLTQAGQAEDTDETFNQEHELTQENPPIICPNLQTSDSCSSAVAVCDRSLWSVIGRIRRHTAPDSETEEDQGAVGEPEEPSQEDLREKCGTTGERCELEERAGCSDSSSSSSVASQDTVINTHTHT